MLRKIVLGTLFLLLFSVSTVRADSLAVVLDGTAAEPFQYTDPTTQKTTTLSLSPYGGTLAGQAAQFICVNVNEPIPSKASWLANVTTLGNAANDYTNTQLQSEICLLYTSPSPRDLSTYRMPTSA